MPFHSYEGYVISTYPRKGTETRVFRVAAPSIRISTYPRKGTETRGKRRMVHRRPHFNLSPQGDGNQERMSNTAYQRISTYPRKGTETYLLLWLMKNIRFQLIPARGRKHFHLSIEIMMCIISTYPRKGTETALVNHLVPEVLDFNLSPQGDGNGTQTESLMIDLIFQLIPARGRKPLLHPVRAAGLNNFNLSPQNPLRRCAPALPKGELFQLPLPCTKLPLSGELARRKP